MIQMHEISHARTIMFGLVPSQTKFQFWRMETEGGGSFMTARSMRPEIVVIVDSIAYLFAKGKQRYRNNAMHSVPQPYPSVSAINFLNTH